MSVVGELVADAVGPPLVHTVEEAARELRIGRTLAYALARRYEITGGTAGLPVVRLGNCLRVPRRALLEFATTGRVVPLSELLSHTASLLSRFNDEPPSVPSNVSDQSVDVESSALPKLERSTSRAAASAHVGQQLVLIPTD